MMRMNSFPGIIPWTACIGMFFLLSGCTSEPEVTYGLQPLELQASTADKDRVKSIEQWITILHADLFGEALGSAELFEIKQAFASVGTKRSRGLSWCPISCRTMKSSFRMRG